MISRMLQWPMSLYRSWIWKQRLFLENIKWFDLDTFLAPYSTNHNANCDRKRIHKGNINIGKEEDILGKGVSGKVIVRYHPTLLLVAVKYFFCNGDDDIDHALGEIKIHNKVSGCNVVSLYGYGYKLTSDAKKVEAFCMIMEYCGKGSLEDYILNSTETISETKLLLWIGQIALTLVHIHEQGVVHGDIKTANILISQDDDVRVADYGSAAESGMDSWCRGYYGTQEYDPPEILAQSNSESDVVFTNKVDIWALGCVMYELLIGDLMHQILAKTPRDELYEQIPRVFSCKTRLLLSKLLETDPMKRFSAFEVYNYISDMETLPKTQHCSGPQRNTTVLQRNYIQNTLSCQKEFKKVNDHKTLKSKKNFPDHVTVQPSFPLKDPSMFTDLMKESQRSTKCSTSNIVANKKRYSRSTFEIEPFPSPSTSWQCKKSWETPLCKKLKI